jgi:hypothetical protein
MRTANIEIAKSVQLCVEDMLNKTAKYFENQTQTMEYSEDESRNVIEPAFQQQNNFLICSSRGIESLTIEETNTAITKLNRKCVLSGFANLINNQILDSSVATRKKLDDLTSLKINCMSASDLISVESTVNNQVSFILRVNMLDLYWLVFAMKLTREGVKVKIGEPPRLRMRKKTSIVSKRHIFKIDVPRFLNSVDLDSFFFRNWLLENEMSKIIKQLQSDHFSDNRMEIGEENDSDCAFVPNMPASEKTIRRVSSISNCIVSVPNHTQQVDESTDEIQTQIWAVPVVPDQVSEISERRFIGFAPIFIQPVAVENSRYHGMMATQCGTFIEIERPRRGRPNAEPMEIVENNKENMAISQVPAISQSRSAKKRSFMKVGLSKKQKFKKHLHNVVKPLAN